jgi:hypothetical protein
MNSYTAALDRVDATLQRLNASHADMSLEQFRAQRGDAQQTAQRIYEQIAGNDPAIWEANKTDGLRAYDLLLALDQIGY